MSKILLFDAAPTGHHGEFLENIIYGISRALSSDCRVLTHPDLRLRLQTAKVDSGSEIRLSYLGRAHLDAINGANSLFDRGRVELKIVEDACAEFGVKKVLLMHMNVHQFALCRMLNKPSISVRGIILDPYTPLRRAYTWKSKVFAGLTSLRKHLQFRLMFCNPQINRVFLLNDAAVAEELNRFYLKRRPFASIVDPIPALSTRAPTVTSLVKNEGKRCTFLLFGSMAPRKGCMLVLKAMQQLTSSELARLRLRIVGKFTEGSYGYKSEVLGAIKKLELKCSELEILVEDHYIDFSEMDVELSAADCILVPYIEFYGSSGVLGHACRAGKPVISCEDGLIGELVRKLEFGLTVNSKDLDALCRCLRIALDGKLPFNTENAAKYVKDADHKNFSHTLIKDWNE